MKNINRNIILCITLGLGILFFSSFTTTPKTNEKKPHEKSNLKVLPKNISHKQLMAIMHSYEQALGFSCKDCHAASKTNPKRLDFASYANPNKKTALKMMRMVKRLNRRQFYIRGQFPDNYLYCKYYVTCVTCHQGKKIPPYHIDELD